MSVRWPSPKSWLIVISSSLLILPLHSVSGANLWWRGDQHDYRHQQMIYHQAEAAYRKGEFTEAAELFRQLPGALGHYNRGNALVGRGDLPAALAAYQQALALDPELTIARDNYERLQQYLNPPPATADAEVSDAANGGEDTAEPATTGAADNGDSNDQDQEPPMEERAAEWATDGDEPGTHTADSEGMTADSDDGHAEPAQAAADEAQWEQQQAIEQQLRRVHDDPSGLLRRKFLHQYSHRHD